MENEVTINGLIEEGKIIRANFGKSQGDFAIGYHHKDNSRFDTWLQTARRYISCNYPDDRVVDDFQAEVDKYEKLNYLYPESMDGFIGVLISCKVIPQVVKQPNKAKHIETPMNNNINISQHQEQTQSQKQSVDIFLEAIKDDLTGKQVKELKQIVVDANNDLIKAKPKLIEKISSFGIDVTSNIVANILTNPVIWGCL
jgi:hypothetical protein